VIRRRMPDEFELIARYFAPLARDHPGSLGLTDDAAVFEVTPGHSAVATTDALVAGIHFPADEAANLIGRKLLRVNLSDLAAMGARPVGYLLDTILPRSVQPAWMEDFVAGLRQDQTAFAVGLLGGDTVAGDGPLTLALTAIGEVPTGSALRRSGARPGDVIYVSGTIGDGALGLLALQEAIAPTAAACRFLIDRYRLPQPRLPLGLALRDLANAAIDISDGLVADLGHVCEASGVGAEVEAGRIPLSHAGAEVTGREPARMATVLTGGDDYELLFSAEPRAGPSVAALAASLDLPLTAIGHVTDGLGVRVIGADGRDMALETGGFRHF